MGKGKKAKGKKRSGGRKRKEENPKDWIISDYTEPSQEQIERSRLAASNRTEDPLKNWTRLQNEECPICMLPLPFLQLNWSIEDRLDCETCGTTTCMGCLFGSVEVHKRDCTDRETAIEKIKACPFCRSNTAVDDKTLLDITMKRAEAGNHDALVRIAACNFDGIMGLRQDNAEGLKWCLRAAEAGSGQAAYLLGGFYLKGERGVDKDHDKALEYYQKSAGLGHIPAFNLIGAIHMERGEMEEAMLNVRKASICGMSDGAIFNLLRFGFTNGYITKDEYAFTLRENQKACNEMKSVDRERAMVLLRERGRSGR